MGELAKRRLGHSGIEVSIVGLGCNNFGRRLDLVRTQAVVEAALQQGIDFLDTADIYGGEGKSEELLGEVLAGHRDEVVLATKFGMDFHGDPAHPRGPRGSRDYVMHAIEGSLRRLRTNVIDVYWYHEPDGETPIAETLGALDELVRDGVVRAIGASNFSARQIAEADEVAREEGLTRFTAIQNEYSLLVRDPEAEVLPLCERLDLAFVPYFPLASGLLTGKYRRGEPVPGGTRLSGREEVASEEQWELIEALAGFARHQGTSMLDVAFGGLLRQPAVASAIAGATTPEQVKANAAAARWRPTPEALRELDQVLSVRSAP